MAGNLIVAFTATVVGLLVSSIAYGIGEARRTWPTRDVTDLEFVCRQVTPEERRTLQADGGEDDR